MKFIYNLPNKYKQNTRKNAKQKVKQEQHIQKQKHKTIIDKTHKTNEMKSKKNINHHIQNAVNS